MLFNDDDDDEDTEYQRRLERRRLIANNVNAIVDLAESKGLTILHKCATPINCHQPHGEAIEYVYYAPFDKIINRLDSLASFKKLTPEQLEQLEEIKTMNFNNLEGIFILSNVEYTSFGFFCPYCGVKKIKGQFTTDTKNNKQ